MRLTKNAVLVGLMVGVLAWHRPAAWLSTVPDVLGARTCLSVTPRACGRAG